MPIYEYHCEVCAHRFEKLVPMSASPPPCPECGGDEVRKLVSAAAFVLKGSGWYKDHYGLKPGASSSSGSRVNGKSHPPSTDSSAAKSDTAKNSAPTKASSTTASASS